MGARAHTHTIDITQYTHIYLTRRRMAASAMGGHREGDAIEIMKQSHQFESAAHEPILWPIRMFWGQHALDTEAHALTAFQ